MNKKISSKLGYLFLMIVFLWIGFILLYHNKVESKYKEANILDGTFVITKSQNGELEIGQIALLGKIINDGFEIKRVVDIKSISEPLVFRFIPVLLSGEPSQIATEIWKARLKKQCILEVRKDGVFQKTGNLKWRFFHWGIIGGSKAKNLDTLYSDVESITRFIDTFILSRDKPYTLPFKTAAVYTIASPFWITFLLLIIFAILFPLAKHKEDKTQHSAVKRSDF